MAATEIQEQLRVLKELQDIDCEAKSVRAERRKLEQELADIDADLDRIRDMVAKLDEDLDALQAERRELHHALEVERENVVKAESRLPEIKTQKEYIAVLKEVDTAKKLNRDLEERIEQKDAEIAALEQERGEKDGELSTQGEKMSARRTEIEEQLAQFDASLGSKEGDRDSLLQQIPAPVRKRYQMLLDRRGGIAVVGARQGACQGCNMHLPPQVFNSLYRNEELQSCPHCNRLIYLDIAESA